MTSRMVGLALGFAVGLFLGSPASAVEADYHETFVPLDAESLAEAGIKQAYEELLPQIHQYTGKADVQIEEVIGEYSEFYIVHANGRKYPIYQDPEDLRSWDRATFVFFEIVNGQLEGAKVKLYAIGAGNELGGVFLTLKDLENARQSTPNPQEWPYIPTMEDPWNGLPR